MCATLYQKNIYITLSGELGAGKTTLTQGLGAGLTLGENLVSPTYAIENRYGNTLLHMDLYRLDSKEARRIVEESSEFPGIRVIEWPERALSSGNTQPFSLDEENGVAAREIEEDHAQLPDSSVRLGGRDSLEKSATVSPEEKGIAITIIERSATERRISITFHDLTLPDRTQIETWRSVMRLPTHVGKHCDAVAAMAKKLGEALVQRGIPVRLLALERAGELHDLLRFIDFRPEVQKKIPHAAKADAETEALWQEMKKRYPQEHEQACAQFLEHEGYPELGTIIRPHGLRSIVEEPETIRTIEQRLLFYADKRVKFDQIVSIDERFDEFTERYGNGVESAWAKTARERTKEMEKELFGKDVP